MRLTGWPQQISCWSRLILLGVGALHISIILVSTCLPVLELLLPSKGNKFQQAGLILEHITMKMCGQVPVSYLMNIIMSYCSAGSKECSDPSADPP